jgi:hypothetical protein
MSMKKGLTPATVTVISVLIIAAIVAVGLIWFILLR